MSLNLNKKVVALAGLLLMFCAPVSADEIGAGKPGSSPDSNHPEPTCAECNWFEEVLESLGIGNER